MPKNFVNTSKKCKQVGFGGGVPNIYIYITIYTVYTHKRNINTTCESVATWESGNHFIKIFGHRQLITIPDEKPFLGILGD